MNRSPSWAKDKLLYHQNYVLHDVFGNFCQVYKNCKEFSIVDKDYTIPITMSNPRLHNCVSSEKRNKADNTNVRPKLNKKRRSKLRLGSELQNSVEFGLQAEIHSWFTIRHMLEYLFMSGFMKTVSKNSGHVFGKSVRYCSFLEPPREQKF